MDDCGEAKKRTEAPSIILRRLGKHCRICLFFASCSSSLFFSEGEAHVFLQTAQTGFEPACLQRLFAILYFLLLTPFSLPLALSIHFSLSLICASDISPTAPQGYTEKNTADPYILCAMEWKRPRLSRTKKMMAGWRTYRVLTNCNEKASRLQSSFVSAYTEVALWVRTRSKDDIFCPSPFLFVSPSVHV
jgi:hypothetical protein